MSETQTSDQSQSDRSSDEEKVETTDQTSHAPQDIDDLEKSYRKALAAFKAEKTNKDLRRAKTAAKRQWDEAVAASQDGEPLNCRDCSQMFMFTHEDKQFYLDNGWFDKPQRCKKCTTDSKARLMDRSSRDSKTKQMCYTFQMGICGYGDQCKFSHDPKGKKKETISATEDANDNEGGDKKEKKETSFDANFVAKCKRGTKCALKKCRFRHEDSKEGGACAEPMNLCKVIATTDETSSTKPVDAKDDGKKKKKKVAKAMTKALQKAPSKQMKMKKLRKLVKAKMEEKNLVLGKEELKKVMRETIASSKDKIAEEGEIVRLVQ